MAGVQAGRKKLAVASVIREVIRQSPEYKGRAIHYLKHAWKIRVLSKALAQALADSYEASSWPGDRLPVGFQMSEEVELITQRIQRETERWGAQVTHP